MVVEVLRGRNQLSHPNENFSQGSLFQDRLGRKPEYLHLTPSLGFSVLLILSPWSSGERTAAWHECGKIAKGLGMR
jgi:hypothetical protein